MPSSSEHRNRLAAEKSPYLLQHAANPVDWYPWGEEALRRAETEDKPIFLSIGYSTCHWCHVMERESFENEAIAAYLNEHFVCIKVDREERPDLDNLYMTAVQAMTGSGGWPMSVFLTPELKPFFAGTYFPPEDRYGRPGFPSLLHRIVELWNGDRSELLASSEQVADFLRRQAAPAGDVAAETLTAAFQDTLARDLERLFDGKRGGFSGAPKFPTPHKVSWLLRHHARTGSKRSLEMARVTLDAMANGGIHDHLAGGFHRYSTDATWLVPHFEKMLYDQAGLALAYVDGWLATADPNYEAVARGTLDYVLAYLTDPAGGFRSAEDADSEGVEGKFYVWSAAEIDALLGPEAGERFRTAYRVTAAGNWEGVNILHTAELGSLRDPAMIEARRTLLAARDRRIRPHLDDKIVTAWNGFMIEAFARAGRAFDEPRYVDAAVRASEFVDEHLRRDGRLLRHHRGGAADVPGFLDDYAFLGRGWLALYETTGDPRWLAGSIGLARDLVRLFGRPEGGFVYSGADAETLLAPVVEIYDGAMPSGNSAAATFLLRLGHLTADPALKDAGWGVLRAFSPLVRRSPVSFVDLAAATDFAAGPALEIVLAGDPDDPALRAMRRAVATRHLPQAVTAHRPPGDAPEAAKLISYLSAQGPIDGRATGYVCRDYACRLPVHDADALARMLDTETARQPAR